MDRSGSWLLSAVIHGAVLLGALLPALSLPGSLGGKGDGSGFQVAVRESGWKVEVLERPVEFLVRKGPWPLPEASGVEPLPDLVAADIRPGCGPAKCCGETTEIRILCGMALRCEEFARKVKLARQRREMFGFIAPRGPSECICQFRVAWRHCSCGRCGVGCPNRRSP
jgi:hypothetical protein